MAIGILTTYKQIQSENINEKLSLDGSLLLIKEALSIAIKAREEGYKYSILPK